MEILTAGPDDAALTVVFVHGWGARKEIWWNALKSLPENARGIAVDLPDDGSHAVMDEFACWLHDFCLVLGSERIFLAGHSLGGNLCAQTALLFPRTVSGLILVDAALRVEDLPVRARWTVSPHYGLAALRAARLAAWPMAIMGSRVPHEHAGGHWAPYARRAWLYVRGSGDPALQRHMQVLLANTIHPEQLRALRIPLLVIHGERDGIVPVEQARQVAAAVPSAVLRIMPRAMHCPMDWDPPLFSRYLRDFLPGTSPPDQPEGIMKGSDLP
jgi:pimeloyl-ACP methyl ester carboxylesterase